MADRQIQGVVSCVRWTLLPGVWCQSHRYKFTNPALLEAAWGLGLWDVFWTKDMTGWAIEVLESGFSQEMQVTQCS